MAILFKSLGVKKNMAMYTKTSEYRFFVDNYQLVQPLLKNYKLGVVENNPFKLIEANILIKAIKNKNLYEEKIAKIDVKAMTISEEEKEKIIKKRVWEELDKEKAPYFVLGSTRIYLPIYSKGLNLIYNDSPSKLKVYPYAELKENPLTACIDLFDIYNFDLFASSFTNLMLIKVCKTSAAFYHREFETIFVINDQGRLDLSIKLFDRYIKNPSLVNMDERVSNVVDKFYSNDRKEFIKSLYDNKFISFKTYHKLGHKVCVRLIKKDRLVRKGKTPNEVL